MPRRNAPLTETGRLRLMRCIVEDGWSQPRGRTLPGLPYRRRPLGLPLSTDGPILWAWCDAIKPAVR